MALPSLYTDLVTRFGVTFNISSSTNTLTVTNFIATGYTNYSVYKGLLELTDPDGVIFYQNVGIPTSSYAAPDFDGAGTPVWIKSGIALPLDSDGKVKKGTYTFKCLSSINGVTGLLIGKTYLYDYETPVVEIDWTISCKTSEITATDATEYDVTCSGVSYTPSMVHTFSLIKPPTAGCNAPSDSTTLVNTFGAGGTAATDLWTKWWTAKVSTVATYSLATWDAYTWVTVIDTITGEDATDVECFDLSCLYLCVIKLFNSWKDSITTGNIATEARLHLKVDKVQAAWTSYELCLQNGASTATYLNEILTIVESEDCTCPSTNDDHSHRVISWASGTGTASLPNGAWHLYTNGTTISDLYYKSSIPFAFSYSAAIPTPGWVLVAHLEGATGGAGAAGADGGNTSILWNDTSVSSSAAGTSVEKLKTYTLPANLLGAANDIIRIFALFEFALNDNGKTIGLDFGGTTLAQYFTDGLANADNKWAAIRTMITRDTVTHQTCVSAVERYGQPGAIISPKLVITTENLAVDQDIDAWGQNSVAAAADIMCKQLEVEIANFETGVAPTSAVIKQGTISIVGGAAAAQITFATAFAAIGYTPNITGFDSGDNWQPISISDKQTTGFKVYCLESVSATWTAILV